MPRIPRFELEPFGRPEFDPKTGKPLEIKAPAINAFDPIQPPKPAFGGELVQPQPVVRPAEAITKAHEAAVSGEPTTDQRYLAAAKESRGLQDRVFEKPEVLEPDYDPTAGRVVNGGKPGAKLPDGVSQDDAWADNSGKAFPNKDAAMLSDAAASEESAPRAFGEKTEFEKTQDAEAARAEKFDKVGEGAKKAAVGAGLGLLGIGGLAAYNAFQDASSSNGGANHASGPGGASPTVAAASGVAAKTPAQIAAEQAEAKRIADNTPDARLPGGGKAFMQDEGPFALSGGQKGKFAENVLVGKGGQSMPETGQQLIDRLRSESGQTVAVRSKRAADDRAAGNAVADEAAAANQKRIIAQRDAATKSAAENKKLQDFTNGRVSAASNLNTASGDVLRNKARAAAPAEYKKQMEDQAAAKLSADKLAMEGKAIDATRDVGIAQAGKVAQKQDIEAKNAESHARQAAVAEQKANLGEFLKSKADNAASYGPRLLEIANAFSNHFFTPNSPEQSALNFNDNKAPSPGEVEAGLSRAFEDSQDPQGEANYSHALELSGLPDTMEHRALLAIRMARAGKNIHTKAGQHYIENHFQ